jgi:hypothetical protein
MTSAAVASTEPPDDIEEKIKLLDSQTIAGAWRALCAGMIAHAVEAMRAETTLLLKTRERPRWFKKDEMQFRKQSISWLDGGRGVVTYEDCCEALDIDPGRLRNGIVDHCKKNRRRPPNGRWRS